MINVRTFKPYLFYDLAEISRWFNLRLFFYPLPKHYPELSLPTHCFGGWSQIEKVSRLSHL